MSPLRQKMIDAMRLRGFSERTHQSYIAGVQGLARYYRQPLETLSEEQLQNYILYLVKERELSPSSCRLSLNAIRFLYLQVLKRPEFDVQLIAPKRPQRIPELLTSAEVARIIEACENLRNQTLLHTCYGCGLRVSELVALKVRHIDGELRSLRIEQAKGAKDRYVTISEHLLHRLRCYWQCYRPTQWLFTAQHRIAPLSMTCVQKIFTAAKAKAGVSKIGGIHSLRHAYATHHLMHGMPINKLQVLLGHSDLRTTLTYLHWVPDYRKDEADYDLTGALEEVGHER